MAKGFKSGGRIAGTPNKATADVRAAAQEHTTAAIDRLAYLMENATSEAAQVAACRELLDRGHGRPNQSISGPKGEAFDPLGALLAAISGKTRGLPSEDNRPAMVDD